MFTGPGFCFYAAAITGACSDSHPLTAAVSLLCSSGRLSLNSWTIHRTLIIHAHPTSVFYKYSEIFNLQDISASPEIIEVRDEAVTELLDDTGQWTFQMIRGFVPFLWLRDILIFCSDARSEICFLEIIYLSSRESAQEIFESEKNLQNMTNWRHSLTQESDETSCLKSIKKAIY